MSDRLALTGERVDLKDRRITFRPVQVPRFLDTFKLVHNIRATQKHEGRRRGVSCQRDAAWLTRDADDPA